MEGTQVNAQNNNQLSAQRNSAEFIIDFLRIITQEGDYHDSMHKALEALSEIVIADRIYVLEQQGRLDGRIFEWCAEGIAPRIARIKEVSDSKLAAFVNAFRGCDIIYGDTLDKVGFRDPRTFAYFRALNVESLLVVPLRDNGRFVGAIGADNFKLSEDIDVKRILETISPFLATVISNYQLLEELEWAVTHDMLTELLNRRGVDAALTEYLSDTNAPFALALIDIDDFKGINDQHGHAAGDAALKTAAQIMKNIFPRDAILGRQGGDELVVVLTGDSVGQADSLFQGFSHETISIEHEGEEFGLTFSIGFTSFPDEAPTVRKAYNQADRALYAVKNSGKAGVRRFSQCSS